MKECDFLPANYREAQSLRGALKLRVALVGLMTGLMVLWVVVNRHQIQQANAMIAQVAVESQQVSMSLERKAAMEKTRAVLAAHRDLLDALDDPASVVVVLADVTGRMPETIILSELVVDEGSLKRDEPGETETKPEQHLTGVPPLGAAARKNAESPEPEPASAKRPSMVLRGLAPETTDIIHFAAELERSPLLERVQMDLQGRGEWGGRLGQKFELVCRLRRQERGR